MSSSSGPSSTSPSTSPSASFIQAPAGDDNDSDSPISELASLPSSPTTSTTNHDSSTSSSAEEGESDAEREWKESLQQLELLLTMVVVPYVGKYFGRKCAYWGWAKFMQWKYPSVEILVTNEKLFKGAGAVEAAASL